MATRSGCEATFHSRRPPLRLTLAEAIALVTPTPHPSMDKLLAKVPRGDGHAVLVLPALARGDTYTAFVRSLLTELGYTAFGWSQGVNVGPTRRLLDGTVKRLMEIASRHGQVSIVGFSMGGLFARWLGHQFPERVRQVITICSPIHDAADNFWLPLKPLLGMWPGVDLTQMAEDVARPMPVPITCLYSRDDGLVNWMACRDEQAPVSNLIEVSGPHVLVAHDARVMEVLAERLALTPTRTIVRPPCATTW